MRKYIPLAITLIVFALLCINVSEKTTTYINLNQVAAADTFFIDTYHTLIPKVSSIFYAGSNSTLFPDLDACVDSADNKSGTIIISDTVSMTSSVTVPSNVNLRVERGGLIDASSSVTLTVQGAFDAGIYRCFDSDVTVEFDTGTVAEVYPEWWGLSTDSTDEVALNAMFLSLPDKRKPVMKLTGTYYTKDTWLMEETDPDSMSGDCYMVEGYGSAIYSTADTVIKVHLGWYTQAEHLKRIEGVRIFGDGYNPVAGASPDDQDPGTNIGIAIVDVSHMNIVDCALRNLGDAIQIIHKGPGTIRTPYCDAPQIIHNVIEVCDRGIVFVDDDVTAGVTADFDQGLIWGNRIGIGNGDADTLDACIVVGDSTRISRSIITHNFFLTTDSTNVMYINGGIGGCMIDIIAECTNGDAGMGAYVFRLGSGYEMGGAPGTTWGVDFPDAEQYNAWINIRQLSGDPNICFNHTKKRFNYQWYRLSSDFGGAYAMLDWTDNVTGNQLNIMSVGTMGFKTATVMYNFQGDISDSIITDVSGHQLDGYVDGTSVVYSTNVEYPMRRFNGTSDFFVSNAHQLNKDRMIIMGFLPDSAYNCVDTKRAWKWYVSASDLAYCDHATGSTITFEITNSTGTTTCAATEAYAIDDPLVIACVIDSVNNYLELWLNGHRIQKVTYAGDLAETEGYTTIGAEYGGLSVFTGYDVAFFAVYPYIDYTMLKDITKNILHNMNGDDNYVEIYNENKGSDIASASTVLLGAGNFFDITGTTGIDSIDVNSPQEAGAVIYLQFDGAVTVSNGKNLKLGSNFVSAADTVLTLIRADSRYFHKVP